MALAWQGPVTARGREERQHKKRREHGSSGGGKLQQGGERGEKWQRKGRKLATREAERKATITKILG